MIPGVPRNTLSSSSGALPPGTAEHEASVRQQDVQTAPAPPSSTAAANHAARRRVEEHRGRSMIAGSIDTNAPAGDRSMPGPLSPSMNPAVTLSSPDSPGNVYPATMVRLMNQAAASEGRLNLDMTPALLDSLDEMLPKTMVRMMNQVAASEGRLNLRAEAQFAALHDAVMSDDAMVFNMLHDSGEVELDVSEPEQERAAPAPISGPLPTHVEEAEVQTGLEQDTDEISLSEQLQQRGEPENHLPPLPPESLHERADIEPERADDRSRMTRALEKMHLKKPPKPLTEDQKAHIGQRLAEIQQRTQNWEKNHPMDLAKFAQALVLVEQGRADKLPVLRNKKYSEAAQLALEARGIDAATWKRARHAIGMQGLADVYDSAGTMALIVPAITAATTLGSDGLGEIGGKLLKYVAWWGAYAASNGAGQIVVDGYQDTAVRHEGLPAFVPELSKSMKLGELPREVAQCLREMRPLLQQVVEEGATGGENREAARAILKELEPLAHKLEGLHKKYQARIARAQANFVKYETQVAYKAATAPAVVVAALKGGPFALYGAMAVQQVLQAPFGYLDEILLKKHMWRSGVKYGDFRTQEAIDAGITPSSPEWGPHRIDPKKVEAMWTNPVTVLQSNIEFIYADELADRQRDISKLDKAIARIISDMEKEPEGSGKRQKLDKELQATAAERNGLEAKFATLIRDIGFFEAGIDAIRKGENGSAAWSKLSPDGTIAQALLSSKVHFSKLTAAKFARPGEYTAQVLDRHGGLALPRTVLAGISDGLKLDAGEPKSDAAAISGAAPQEMEPPSGPPGATWPPEASDVAAVGMAQAGIWTGNAYANPVTKFLKQLYIRTLGLPATPTIQDGQVMRENLWGDKRPITGSDWMKPQYEVPLPNGETKIVDITKTRAFWKASHSAASSVALGVRDTVTGLGKHIAAPFTLPFRFGRAALADHQAKSTLAKFHEYSRRFSEPVLSETGMREMQTEQDQPQPVISVQEKRKARDEGRIGSDAAKEQTLLKAGTSARVLTEADFPEVPTDDPAVSAQKEHEPGGTEKAAQPTPAS